MHLFAEHLQPASQVTVSLVCQCFKLMAKMCILTHGCTDLWHMVYHRYEFNQLKIEPWIPNQDARGGGDQDVMVNSVESSREVV